ncbi:hypothetical protein DV451_002603 [Geotrichum candidum]|uniref:Rab-GAP TBC domain-containing protein n=1 Tax=Geotrichum candidum TaxID=1173061 RepID=A0A9P5G5V5_GEOCN|nr:hypothetical protein DV451_002603 [Geotrichum candidum]KAF5106109.1 hypothetical protein DV453_004226 [Geotrichum candidum]
MSEPSVSVYNDETDTVSIVSASAASFSTVISASKETGIDWDALVAVESRMVSEDSDYTLFVERLNLVKDEDFEETHYPLLSVPAVRNIIDTSGDKPFNDIPNIPTIAYDDSELSLWAALLADYRNVVMRVPKYANIMVRSGIPPALRGFAWKSMAEAGSPTLESLYDSLAAEWTPFVKIIGRDLNRTFPDIQMFRENGGDGQMKLGRVLRAYSAYDMQVGYCQGLTFLTGPLLLHMDDRDAFCVLVKLMEDYELRTMFTADMAGLQLRMYQFENLFADEFPDLYEHFTTLGVNSIYASQWFLSFFAVTCPLGMLVRIFDLTFAEGAIPTIMRVALSILKRNKHILMAFDDDEEILQHMLGRCLWDSYGLDADLLITDVTSIQSVTNERLRELEMDFGLGGKPIRSKVAKQEESGYSFLFPFFKWPAAPVAESVETASTKSAPKETDSRNSSRMSMVSYDSEVSTTTLSTTSRNASYRSSASSFTSYEPSLSKLSFANSENQTLRDKVAALTAEVEKLKFELQNRDRLRGDAPDSGEKIENPCCEKLRMELALVKTNEVLARQEIEQLKHALHTARQPTGPEAPQAKGWSLW